MMYKVQLSLDAEKFFANSDKSLAKKLAKCFKTLEENPLFHPNIKALKGNYSGCYRYRVGDYRVIYSLDDEIEIVLVNVILIAHRSNIYDE